MFRFKHLTCNSPWSVQEIAKRHIHRKNSYYDLLGVTPKATHSDIKKAFYKLSMKFHPDTSTGDDAKFREISTAYEILGNLKLRKLYDRGELPVGASVSTYESIKEEEVEEIWVNESFRKMRNGPYTRPEGKTSAYDYDEWIRQHYSDAFTRSRHPFYSRTREGDFQDLRWSRFDNGRNDKNKNKTPEEEIPVDAGERFLLIVLLATIFLSYQSTLISSSLDRDRPRKSIVTPQRHEEGNLPQRFSKQD